MKKILGGISAVLAFLFIFSSCNLDNGTTTPQTGFFLVANVSPDAPHLAVTINNSNFDTGFVFGNYTRSHYVSATAGVYNFIVYPTGTSTPVLNNNLNVEANKVYSYFIIDSFTKVKSTVVEDVFRVPSSDSVYIRFFNFSPNTSQPLDVIDSTNGFATLFSGRTFNDQVSNPSFASFTEIPAGTRTLVVKQIDGTHLLSQDVTLTGGKVYTLMAQGTITGTGSQAFSLGQLENYPQQ